MGKNVRIHSLKQLHIVLGEFKRRLFEVEVPRRTSHHVAKIDVNYMAELIHKNIIVVPILNLKYILEKAIP